MSEYNYRYFKVGYTSVKLEYTKFGVRCAYIFNNESKEFEIDNTFIEEVMNGEDVSELSLAEFNKITNA